MYKIIEDVLKVLMLFSLIFLFVSFVLVVKNDKITSVQTEKTENINKMDVYDYDDNNKMICIPYKGYHDYSLKYKVPIEELDFDYTNIIGDMLYTEAYCGNNSHFYLSGIKKLRLYNVDKLLNEIDLTNYENINKMDIDKLYYGDIYRKKIFSFILPKGAFGCVIILFMCSFICIIHRQLFKNNAFNMNDIIHTELVKCFNVADNKSCNICKENCSYKYVNNGYECNEFSNAVNDKIFKQYRYEICNYFKYKNIRMYDIIICISLFVLLISVIFVKFRLDKYFNLNYISYVENKISGNIKSYDKGTLYLSDGTAINMNTDIISDDNVIGDKVMIDIIIDNSNNYLVCGMIHNGVYYDNISIVQNYFEYSNYNINPIRVFYIFYIITIMLSISLLIHEFRYPSNNLSRFKFIYGFNDYVKL